MRIMLKNIIQTIVQRDFILIFVKHFYTPILVKKYFDVG